MARLAKPCKLLASSYFATATAFASVSKVGWWLGALARWGGLSAGGLGGVGGLGAGPLLGNNYNG